VQVLDSAQCDAAAEVSLWHWSRPEFSVSVYILPESCYESLDKVEYLFLCVTPMSINCCLCFDEVRCVGSWMHATMFRCFSS